MSADTVYCINCDEKTAYTVKCQRVEMTVRGIVFSYVEQTAYCSVCGEETYVAEINDLNVASRDEAYRKAVEGDRSMNDYKELVEYLRKMHNVMLHNDNVESGVPEENITDVDAIACREAADAIEQLVKERDAAVADLRAVITSSAAWLNFCDFCNYQEPDGQCFHDCTPYNDKWGWQWRGVQEANNGT